MTSQEVEAGPDEFLDESGGSCATDQLRSISKGENVMLEWGWMEKQGWREEQGGI